MKATKRKRKTYQFDACAQAEARKSRGDSE